MMKNFIDHNGLQLFLSSQNNVVDLSISSESECSTTIQHVLQEHYAGLVQVDESHESSDSDDSHFWNHPSVNHGQAKTAKPDLFLPTFQSDAAIPCETSHKIRLNKRKSDGPSKVVASTHLGPAACAFSCSEKCGQIRQQMEVTDSTAGLNTNKPLNDTFPHKMAQKVTPRKRRPAKEKSEDRDNDEFRDNIDWNDPSLLLYAAPVTPSKKHT